jgi:hypothetical protein
MGADLIVAAARWPQYTDGEAVGTGDAGAWEVLRFRARNLDRDGEAMARLMDEARGASTFAEMRAMLVKAVDLIREGGRDLTTLLLDGVKWLVTGGMTWGDDPTDAYQYVRLLDASGITDEPIAYGADIAISGGAARTITLYATVKGDASDEKWADAIFEAATVEGGIHALRTNLLGITLPTEEGDDDNE